MTARERYNSKDFQGVRQSKDCQGVLQIKGLPGSNTIKMTDKECYNQNDCQGCYKSKDCYNQNDCQEVLHTKDCQVALQTKGLPGSATIKIDSVE